MENLTLGMVFDIMTESLNDEFEWDTLATDEDIANF